MHTFVECLNRCGCSSHLARTECGWIYINLPGTIVTSVLGGQLTPCCCIMVPWTRQIPHPKGPTLSSCIDDECNISPELVIRHKRVQNLADRYYWPTTLCAVKTSAIIEYLEMKHTWENSSLPYSSVSMTQTAPENRFYSFAWRKQGKVKNEIIMFQFSAVHIACRNPWTPLESILQLPLYLKLRQHI